MTNVIAIIVVRNEPKLPDVISSIKNQVDEIIIVDDGSIPEVNIENYKIIRFPPHKESYIGRPELATRWNAGLAEADKNQPNYIATFGGDHLVEPDYIKKIIEKMKQDGSIIASGRMKERYPNKTPLGSGRVVDAIWWHNLNNTKYPINWGWEAWLLAIARMEEKLVSVYQDLELSFTRPTKWSWGKGVNWGKGAWCLGIHPAQFGLRLLSTIFNQPIFTAGLAWGYLIHWRCEQYSDVPKYNNERAKKRIREIFKF